MQYEPGDFRDYSDTRPDLAGGGMYLGDTKVKAGSKFYGRPEAGF